MIFLDDVVADLILVVDTRHGCIDLRSGGNPVTKANGVVIITIFLVFIHEVLVGDDQHIVSVDFTASGRVAVHHFRVLCQTFHTVLYLGGSPKHVAVIGFGGFQVDAHLGRLGIHYLTGGGDVLHWGKG